MADRFLVAHGDRRRGAGAAVMEMRPAAAVAVVVEVEVAAPRQLPPGFRFHPTDEEVVAQYLLRKVLSRPLPAAVIPVVHGAARLDPWDLPGASDGEAYFFSLREAPARGNRRRAGSGYWKATGKEKPVFLQGAGGKQQLVGVKTALAFHRGKTPSSRTDWVMHEYRLAAMAAAAEQKRTAINRFASYQPREWVVCRVSLKNRARRPPSSPASAVIQKPGNRAAVMHREDAIHHLQHSSPSPSPSSSSCIIDIPGEREEEVSSIKDTPPPQAASQREA